MKKVLTIGLVLFNAWILMLLINSNKEPTTIKYTSELYSAVANEIPKATILFMWISLGVVTLITGVFVWYHYKGYKKHRASPEASMVIVLAHLVFIVFTIFGGLTRYSGLQEYWNILLLYLIVISVKVLTIMYIIPKRIDYEELMKEMES